jgi:hypothetical protein
MKIRSFAVLLTSLAGVAACDGLREALTTHVDVVARAERQELSVNRAGELLGNTTLQIPVNRETAMILSDLWVNYHLLGVAAARGDSLLAPELIDDATFGMTANARLRRFMEGVSASAMSDTASATTYNQATGDLFVARHILLAFPEGMTAQQKDSVRRRAEQIRSQATPRNFADLARRHSTDQGSAQQGGNLGPFPRGRMVKPFGDAVAALRPGDISPLVETQFGYHIIYRPTYAEAREDYAAAYEGSLRQRAESTYVAALETGADINVRSNAVQKVREAARDIPAHRQEDDVIATFNGGEMTLGRFVQWVESFPAQNRIPQQLADAQTPDSLVRMFVHSLARNEVMLSKADSAGVVVTPEEKEQLYAGFRSLVLQLWQQLGVDPLMLADSARTEPERERMAANRVEAYLDRMMMGQAQVLNVPAPVQSVLMATYSWKINAAGVDRAVERARTLRSTADSARSAQQPPSQVPLPGSPGATTPPQP